MVQKIVPPALASRCGLAGWELLGSEETAPLRSRLFALLLVASCLALNIAQAHSVGMDRVVSFWAAQAIAPALSNLCFHHPHDYTALVEVRDRFGPIPWQPTVEQVNRGIETILSVPPDPIDRMSYLVSTDDKGIIDFVRLAFVLFGYRAESLLILYWTGLAAGCLVFLLRFGTRPWATAMLVAFLLAHCSVLPVVAINPQLRSVLALRFMSLWGVVATLHLILEIRSEEPPRPARCLAVVLQAAMVIFVLHIRFSAIWEVIAIEAATAAMVFRIWRSEGIGKRLLPALMSAALVLIGAGGLNLYKRAVIAPAYYQGGGASHVFWHSVFSGLAYSPELRPRFGIRIDDASIMNATHRFLVEHRQARRWESIGQNEQRYDRAVREMFFATCREHPGEVLSTVVYHKPRALALYIAWFMRLAEKPPDSLLLWPGAKEELDEMALRMDHDDRSLRLFRPGCALMLLAVILWAYRSLRNHCRDVIGILAILATCSLMPGLLGYPTAHTILDAVACFGMLIYLAVMLAAGMVLEKFA